MTIAEFVIDGKSYVSDIREGGGDFIIQVSRDSASKTVNLGLTSSIDIIGDAYNHLYNKYYPDCQGLGAKGEAVIVPNCCDGKQFKFELSGDNILFNPIECKATVSLVTISDALKKYNALRNRTWWQNDFVRNGVHPKIKYFIDPNFWHRLTGGLPTTDFGDSRHFGYHITPYIYPILVHNAQQAGLTFRSDTIFDLYPEYKKLGITMSQFKEGLDVDNDPKDGSPNWDDARAPIETTMELLNNLAGLFNADTEITSSELRFERDDWWQTNNASLFDLTTEIARKTISGFSGFQPDLASNYAFGRFEYQADSVDHSSRRAKWLFSDIVEWNQLGDPSLKGSLDVTVPYSNLHTIADQAYYENIRDKGESATAMRRIWQDINEDNNGVNFVGDEVAMYMTSGMTQAPKVLLVSDDTDFQGQGIWPDPIDQFGHVPPKFRFVPFGFDLYGNVVDISKLPISPKSARPIRIANVCQELSFRQTLTKGLYQRFYAIEQTTNRRCYNIGEITYYPDDFCEVVDFIFQNGMRTSVQTEFGVALADSININFTKKNISFRNLKVCRICS